MADRLIIIIFLIVLLGIASLVWALLGAEACFPVQGIDHNDPFTVFLGWC